jgi:hypothetical protein
MKERGYMFQRYQGTTLTFSSGHKARVKRLTPPQFRKAGPGFPTQPWTESTEAQGAYERWFAKFLPFIECTIDQDALAQLRKEMAALDMELPESDKLVWVAYGLCANVEDLEQLVQALVPQVG